MNWKKKLLSAAAAGLVCLGILTIPEMVDVPKSSGTDILATVPAYSGMAYVEIDNGTPGFDADLLIEAQKSFEDYSNLDYLGRPGTAMASVGRDLMPEGEREAIGMIKPAGFSTVRYDDLIEDKYLYNRCHMIGWQLTGENANEKNLITGTRYMNVEGMLPFENQIASYVKRTGNHVLYRVTPIYSGGELLCRGIQLEACSVEDIGSGIRFNVFVYNVQPGIEIDYATGDSWRAAEVIEPAPDQPPSTDTPPAEVPIPEGTTYVLNGNSMKFHAPTCESVADMAEKNRVFTTESRETVMGQGYQPCKRCNP